MAVFVVSRVLQCALVWIRECETEVKDRCEEKRSLREWGLIINKNNTNGTITKVK